MTSSSDSGSLVARSRPQVYWRSRGRGSTVLLLLNGFGASGDAWPSAWLDELASEVRVITPDNRGSGHSRRVDVPFTIQDLADDMVSVLDDAGVDRAVTMGLSMGGMIAQELALRAPERVSALALVATRPPIPRFTQPDPRTTLAFVRPVLPGESLSKYFRRLWSSAAAPGFGEQNPEVIEELVEQTVARPTPSAMLRHQLRAMSGWGHAERLADLDVPTIVVHGAKDRFSPPANATALAKLIPGAKLELLDSIGHLVPHEAPDLLRGHLLDLARDLKAA